MSGFWLDDKYINEFVISSLMDLITRSKQCSICDVDLREAGKNVRFEADWIKYMERQGESVSEALKEALYIVSHSSSSEEAQLRIQALIPSIEQREG
jgi:hypothetical protein